MLYWACLLAEIMLSACGIYLVTGLGVAASPTTPDSCFSRALANDLAVGINHLVIHVRYNHVLGYNTAELLTFLIPGRRHVDMSPGDPAPQGRATRHLTIPA